MPAFMKDAGNTKAHSMWREMAIFILLYVISIFVEAMAMVPGLLVYIASRPDAASWFERAGSSDVTGGLWNGSVDMDKYSALLQAQPECCYLYKEPFRFRYLRRTQYLYRGKIRGFRPYNPQNHN